VSFVTVKEIKEREIFPGFKGKFIHGDRMSVVYWKIQKGALLPEHNHDHEQITSIISGDFKLTVGGSTKILKAGDVAVIPSNTLHSGECLTDCDMLDAFCPTREDYRME
jgi:quercetin dioxygenase-like cupin family protein